MYFSSISGSYNKVVSDERHLYCLCSSGIEILRKENYTEVGHIHINNGTDLWTNQATAFLYITTSGNGLKRFAKLEAPDGNETSYLASDHEYPFIHSNHLTAIDGLNDGYIAIGSASGIELLYGDKTYKSLVYPNVNKIKIAGDGSLYYATPIGLVCKRAPISQDWSSVSYIASQMSTPPIISNTITDIDVLYRTNGNILTVSTPSGITIIRESLGYIGGSSTLNLRAI